MANKAEITRDFWQLKSENCSRTQHSDHKVDQLATTICYSVWDATICESPFNRSDRSTLQLWNIFLFSFEIKTKCKTLLHLSFESSQIDALATCVLSLLKKFERLSHSISELFCSFLHNLHLCMNRYISNSNFRCFLALTFLLPTWIWGFDKKLADNNRELSRTIKKKSFFILLWNANACIINVQESFANLSFTK